MNSTYPHIIPEVKDWPIYKISKNRNSYIQELNKYTYDRLFVDNSLSREELLDKTIYLEKLRSRNNPWKVDPADDKSYWNDLEKEIEIAKTQNDKDERLDKIVRRIINRYNEEIVGSFNLKTFKFSRVFLRVLFKRLFRSYSPRKITNHISEQLKVQGCIDEVRSLFTKGTVVIVPTHFSNLDSILIGYSLDVVVGVPASAYGAGLNLLDNEIVAHYINRLGAYRLDRRKKNPIYLECIKSMSSFSLQKRVNQIFFPRGTRSRNGKLEEKLKLGLLGSMVEAQRDAIQDNSDNKIFIVPLVVSYHFVLEAKSLIDQYLRKTGREKFSGSKSAGKSSSRLMKFLWALVTKKSCVEISFGKPIDVFGNKVDINGISRDKSGMPIDLSGYFKIEGKMKTVTQREKVYTKFLGEKIIESYLESNIVLRSTLVAFAAFKTLMASNSKMGLYDVLNVSIADFEIDSTTFIKIVKSMLSELKRMKKQGKLKLSEELDFPVKDVISKGISHLGLYHPQNVWYITKNETYASEDFKLLYYYHNRLDSYGLENSVKWSEILSNDSSVIKNSMS